MDEIITNDGIRLHLIIANVGTCCKYRHLLVGPMRALYFVLLDYGVVLSEVYLDNNMMTIGRQIFILKMVALLSFDVRMH